MEGGPLANRTIRIHFSSHKTFRPISVAGNVAVCVRGFGSEKHF